MIDRLFLIDLEDEGVGFNSTAVCRSAIDCGRTLLQSVKTHPPLVVRIIIGQLNHASIGTDPLDFLDFGIVRLDIPLVIEIELI